MDTVRRAGGPVSATSRGPGTPRGHFSTLLGGLRGLPGLLRMIGISVAREFAGHPLACNPCLPFSSRPLYESSSLADPYTPVSEGVLLDFDHPPSSVQPPGSGCRPPPGGHYLSCRTPISGVRFRLPPSSKGEFLTPTHPRVQVSRSQLVSDLQNWPPCHLPLPQLSMP